jgi:type I restriction enzyme S subunit
MSWKNVKLGDILTESKEISEFPNPDRRITVRLKVLGVEKRGLENEVEGATKQYIRKAGQFIYGKQNFHKGAFGIVPQELNNFESSSDLPAFDVDKSCLPEFIFYFFKQGNFYLELSKIASGVATQRINTAQLFQLELLLPDIKTQKKLIANIESLETNGGAISTEFKHQLTLVKKLRQQLLQDAVQGKLVEQSRSLSGKDEPASELLKKIKAEKAKLIAEKKLKKEKELAPIKAEEIPFEIPENWVWCRLGEITTLLTDGKHGDSTDQMNSGYYFLSAKDLQNGKFIYDNSRQITYDDFLETHRRTNLEPGDLCVVNTGATIGKTALAPDNELTRNTTFQKSVAILKVVNRYTCMKFVEYFIINETPKLLKTSRGSAINNLLLGDMRNVLFPMPPRNEQNRIVKKLDELMQNCNDLEASIKQSAAQNEKLLQQVLREALRKEPVEA